MESLLCSYRNTCDRMAIVRCCGPEGFHLERVVFPFELLTFHCPPESDVTIWRPGAPQAAPAETYGAEELQPQETPAPRRPDWLPALPQRTVGVRDNASTVCLEPF
jgi:hypothetical protein